MFESRTPRGVRGLKYALTLAAMRRAQSHPSRGAWIEIAQRARQSQTKRSHPSRGAWIEI